MPTPYEEAGFAGPEAGRVGLVGTVVGCRTSDAGVSTAPRSGHQSADFPGGADAEGGPGGRLDGWTCAWTRGTLRPDDPTLALPGLLPGVGGPGRDVRFFGYDLPPCPPGTRLAVSGHWEVHAAYGPQFRVTRARASYPAEARGVERYLDANVAGCGPAIARRLVAVLGTNCLARLEADPSLVLPLVPGGQGVALHLAVEAWAAEARRETLTQRLAVRLLGLGVGEATVRRITRFFTSADAAEVAALRRPYRLLDVPGIGWKTADRIAAALGVAPDAPARLEAACRWVLDAATDEGHAGLPASACARRAAALLAGDRPDTDRPEGAPSRAAVAQALADLEADGLVARAGDLLLRPDVRATEWRVAERTARLLERPVTLSPAESGTLAAALGTPAHAPPPGPLVHQGAPPLTDEQRAGVRLALTSRVSVLTGGPGTGKTTALRALVAGCRALEWPVVVVAPTGKAASRAAAVTGAPASTVHRLLAGLARGGHVSARVVVVDEGSMCDTETTAALLDAVDPARTAVVWTGDADQLPSVGYGQVLADLVRSGHVPVTRLTVVHRQAAASRIVANAHRLLAGKPLDLSPGPDWHFEALPDGDHRTGRRAGVDLGRAGARAVLAQIDHFERAGAVPARDVQVLAPLRRGPLGVEALNALLQNRLNPGGAVGPVVGGGHRARVGDRVVVTRNLYGLPEPLYNGEQGVVTGVDATGLRLRVDARDVDLRGVQCLMTRLAWAITVHRAQGSEYPHVLLLYHHAAHARMLDRRVLYTAMTRARRRFALLGTREAVVRAASSGNASDRYTALPLHLTRALGR